MGHKSGPKDKGPKDKQLSTNDHREN